MCEIIKWYQPPQQITIQPNDLHLWKFIIDPCNLNLIKSWTWLSEIQQARALRINNLTNRNRYLCNQVNLHLILARYLSLDPQQIEFKYGAHGKPYLINNINQIQLSFNLTTSNNLALLAISLGIDSNNELGIDCEQLRPRNNFLALAQRMFRPEIYRNLQVIDPDQQLLYFYQAWTALEAEVKATGIGLFGQSNPFQFELSYQIAHFVPAAGYLAAVARAQLPPIAAWRTFALPESENLF